MSESPLGGAPQGQATWMPPIPVQKSSRVPVIIAFVVAMLALGLAAAAWFKPTPEAPPAAPQYSDQQVADAKKNLCDAYHATDRALTDAGSLSSEDQNQKFMISLNIRVAFTAGADHLLTAADQNPAAPPDLLKASRDLAFSYQKIVLAQTASDTHDALVPLYDEADASLSLIRKVCG